MPVPVLYEDQFYDMQNTSQTGTNKYTDFIYGVKKHAQHLAYLDCLYSMMNKYEYLMFLDRDEILIPKRQPSLVTMLDALELTLADLGGRARRAPPLRVPILSFWHKTFSKRNHLGSPHPLLRGPRPPYRKSWIRHWLKFSEKQIAAYVSTEHHFCTEKSVVPASPNKLMQKLTTKTRITRPGHRIKSIIRPQYVYNMHIHVPIAPLVGSSGIIQLPQFVCAVHHYRNHHKCYNVPVVVDTFALNFQEILSNQIRNVERKVFFV